MGNYYGVLIRLIRIEKISIFNSLILKKKNAAMCGVS